MTPAAIIALVHQLDDASEQAVNWTNAGICCPGTSSRAPCQRPACIDRAGRCSGYWAREAAHLARQL